MTELRWQEDGVAVRALPEAESLNKDAVYELKYRGVPGLYYPLEGLVYAPVRLGSEVYITAGTIEACRVFRELADGARAERTD